MQTGHFCWAWVGHERLSRSSKCLDSNYCFFIAEQIIIERAWNSMYYYR